MTSTALRVVVETTPKKCFASALDWPGWSRSGKTEEDAIEQLLEYQERYGEIARRAGLKFPSEVAAVEVVERTPGNATTAFGAPVMIAQGHYEPLTRTDRAHLVALLEAAWAFLDEVAAGAPAELRKGPRGGGRDTAAVLEHVRNPEGAYARKMGMETRGVPDLHAAVIAFLASAEAWAAPGNGVWPKRFGAQKFIWHILDHAWEIQDRSA